jgi:hypothetical protein
VAGAVLDESTAAKRSRKALPEKFGKLGVGWVKE